MQVSQRCVSSKNSSRVTSYSLRISFWFFTVLKSSHLHISHFIFTSSHLHILSPAHLHVSSSHRHISSSHLHICTYHPLIFTSSHLHICTYPPLIFTSCLLRIYAYHLDIFISCHFHIISSTAADKELQNGRPPSYAYYNRLRKISFLALSPLLRFISV